MNDQLIALINKCEFNWRGNMRERSTFFFRITNVDSEDGVSLNSFNGSLLTQIYNELSQTAL